MKQVEKTKNKSEDVPLATMVIREYKELNREYQALNKSYARANKSLVIIIIILIVLMTIATTYIVLSWESMNPHTGLIREEISK